MQGQDWQSKRERVRQVLLEPMIGAGMRKQTRMSAENYEAMLVRLADKLAYLSDENLRGLVPVLTRFAKGRERNQWPDEVTVVSWAYQMQSPPPRKCDYITSLMCSEAGRRARTLGYHVELFMVAKTLGPPPSKYDLARIEREAAENRAEAERVARAIERGNATTERRQWLAWYQNHEAACLAIMNTQAEQSEGAAA